MPFSQSQLFSKYFIKIRPISAFASINVIKLHCKDSAIGLVASFCDICRTHVQLHVKRVCVSVNSLHFLCVIFCHVWNKDCVYIYSLIEPAVVKG